MAEKRRIYTSFHDIPPREYMYFPKGSITVDKPGRFSRTEIIHILISMLVLTIAFSFWITGGLLFNINNIYLVAQAIPFAFAGVLTGFFFHEASHKFMAQKFGLWAEYRLYPMGLFLALIISVFTGFIFAAPGAVMFMGGSRYHENGKIAVAGPFANIIVAYVTYPLYMYVFFETTIGTIVGFICLINSFLAAFNLFPLAPLDGSKVIKWNATVWIILLILAILILVLISTSFVFSF